MSITIGAITRECVTAANRIAGETGGIPEKIQAAGEVRIDVVIIKRHEIAYPIQCSTVDEVYSFLDSP